MKYRIVQKSENNFIPQFRQSFFHAWKGIDRIAICRVNLYPIWNSDLHQDLYCSVETYQEAIECINNFDEYINYQEEKKKYPIIYDL